MAYQDLETGSDTTVHQEPPLDSNASSTVAKGNWRRVRIIGVLVFVLACVLIPLGVLTIRNKDSEGNEGEGNEGDEGSSSNTPMVHRIEPTGSEDDSGEIQAALDNLIKQGDTLLLDGHFVIGRTVYLPSNFHWVLQGSLTLAANAVLDEVGYVDSDAGIDARAPTAITDKQGGITNVIMSDGTYFGNGANQPGSVRFINFLAATNSKFRDMTVQDASDDNFTLGPLSTGNEVRNIVSKAAGGNALTDKGDKNMWYDCIAEDCLSDGFTPKSRYSEFHRCIARRNLGPGFGLYARLDGSKNNIGEKIVGNKFYACESYENGRDGFSLNVASNSGNGAEVRDNYVQGAFYNNAMEGILFRNKTPDGQVVNNEIDVVLLNNQALKVDGTVNTNSGGLAVEGDNITGIIGDVIGYGNANSDVHLNTATDNHLRVHTAASLGLPVVNKGDDSNNVEQLDFECPQAYSKESWSRWKYCEMMNMN